MNNIVHFNFSDSEVRLLEEFRQLKGLSEEDLPQELHNILVSSVKSKVKVRIETIACKEVEYKVLKAMQGKLNFSSVKAPDTVLVGGEASDSLELTEEYKTYVFDSCLPIAVCQYACNCNHEYLVNSLNGKLRVSNPEFFEFRKVVERYRKYKGFVIEYNDFVKSAEDSMLNLLHNLPPFVKSVKVSSFVFRKHLHGLRKGSSIFISGSTLNVYIALEEFLSIVYYRQHHI